MAYEGSRKEWHLDKHITIGNIITLAALVVAVISYIISNEVELSTLETRLDGEIVSRKEGDRQLRLQMEKLEERNLRQFDDIKKSLIRIENKLDDKVDKDARRSR
jgi:hypothetical protein